MAIQKLSITKSALLEKWLQGDVSVNTEVIPHLNIDTPIPLSFPQQRQLFLELLEPGTAINNLAIFISIKGMLDVNALQSSANVIVARHDVLRTKFTFEQGLPKSEILKSVTVDIPVVDLRETDIATQLMDARRLAETEVMNPFDLSRAPLIKMIIYELSNNHRLLLLTVHHTIADGWSLGVFFKELMIIYQEIANGRSAQLPELPIQYSDYACWQTSLKRIQTLESEMTYWKKQLAGVTTFLDLPAVSQRSIRQTFSGATYRFDISRQALQSIEKICRAEDVTLFMFLLTTYYILLHRYSGQDEILVGTPVANRNLPELENLIGIFINTLVLRVKITNNPSFRELLNRIRNVSLDAYARQDVPFEKLVEDLKPHRDLSRTPLFQTVFNFQSAPTPKFEIPGLDTTLIEIDRGVSQFDLTLMMSVSDKGLQGIVEYNSHLFTRATIQRLFQSYQLLLEDAIANPELAISKMRVLSKKEHIHVVNELNMTEMDFPRGMCMHQLFETQVEQDPHSVAVIYNDIKISYLQLNCRANVLALHLQKLGVGTGVRVGIFMEKSLEMVEALLGVLKAGGAYVPISTSFPPERLEFILKDADVKVLLTNVDPGAIDPAIQVVHLKELLPHMHEYCANPATNATADSLAYIIYTSGSTGQPKGVMVDHSALVNFLSSMKMRPGIRRAEILLSVTSITFDIAALELFLPLIAGAAVIILDKETSTNPIMLQQVINRCNVNIMQATPATWQLLIDSGWAGKPTLKALCGGESLTRKLADQILERVGGLWNMYGPTETTIWSSFSEIRKNDQTISIGQPIGNTQMYVLDHYMQPAPVGVIGELHIGGEGLARGYLNHPDLTSEKFIMWDCFGSKPASRLFKTGDCARYLADYTIEIVGRVDDQVKINGHRIEPGEIAAALMQHPSIDEAIVIARTEISGEKRLVSYFVDKNKRSPEACELRDYLKTKLPAYMVPAMFIRLDSLPLTSNGKIDRKALPVPVDLRPLNGTGVARNRAEQIMTSIWEDVLGVENVGIHDNFFDLGGASIQSLQVVASASLAGLHFNVESIFEHQTIAELVRQLNNEEIAW